MVKSTFYLVIFTGMFAACGDGSSEGPQADEKLRATVETGDLEGVKRDGAVAFLGIPYAEPPIGALRWKVPQAALPWEGVLAVDDWGAACPHTVSFRPGADPGDPDVVGDEDCLTINVFTPYERTADASLPVMFFIHGGANSSGSSVESIEMILDLDGGRPITDGARLAARGDVVIVTFNYRLGVLGFLAAPELAAGSGDGFAGNFGLKDQIAALEWVQRNIAAFGGDPDRVTVFGQSAGAYDTCALLASPLTGGLFSRAIMHSGVCNLHDLDRAENAAADVIAEVGCDTAPDLRTCLQEIPAETFVLADSAQPVNIGNFAIHPHVDGYVALKQPMTALQLGEHNPVPFMIGCASEEYSNRYHPGDFDEQEYRSRIYGLFGQEMGDQVLAVYNSANYGTPPQAFEAMYTDRNLTCSSHRIAMAAASKQTQPVWRYHFRRTLTTNARLGDGAYHTSDLLYLFQHMDGVDFEANDEDRVVEALLLEHWTRFAATGDPNEEGSSAWPEYDPQTDPYYVLDVEPAQENALRANRCLFWQQLMNGD